MLEHALHLGANLHVLAQISQQVTEHSYARGIDELNELSLREGVNM